VEFDITGAQFINAANVGKVKLLGRKNSSLTTTKNTYIATYNAGAGACSWQPLSGKILITCSTAPAGANNSAGWGKVSVGGVGGVVFSMVTLNTASGLATSGSTISLSGTVYNNNAPTQTYESITSGTVITSAAPLTTTVTAGTSVSANASSSPVAFAGLSAIQTSPVVHTSAYSMTLASVHVTGSGAFAANMSTPVTGATWGSSMTVTVTSAALTGAATSRISIGNAGILENISKTPANFVSPYTFSSNAGILSNFAVNLTFNGTTAIPSAAAGTVSIAYGTGGTNSVQGITATGATASIAQGGFHAEAETVLATGSSATYSSYIRLHNNSGNTGNVTVTVRNDTTGAVMGSTYNMSVAANSTVTIGVSTIEGSAGITPTAGTNYTVDFSGQMTGYIQHVLFNPATGALADMSSFRDNGQLAQDP